MGPTARARGHRRTETCSIAIAIAIAHHCRSCTVNTLHHPFRCIRPCFYFQPRRAISIRQASRRRRRRAGPARPRPPNSTPPAGALSLKDRHAIPQILTRGTKSPSTPLSAGQSTHAHGSALSSSTPPPQFLPSWLLVVRSRFTSLHQSVFGCGTSLKARLAPSRGPGHAERARPPSTATWIYLVPIPFSSCARRPASVPSSLQRRPTLHVRC